MEEEEEEEEDEDEDRGEQRKKGQNKDRSLVTLNLSVHKDTNYQKGQFLFFIFL